MLLDDFTQEMLYADLRAKWPAPACLAVKQVFEAYLARQATDHRLWLYETLRDHLGRNSMFISLLQDIARALDRLSRKGYRFESPEQAVRLIRLAAMDDLFSFFKSRVPLTDEDNT